MKNDLCSKKLIYFYHCLLWKTFKEVNLQLMLGIKTNCITVLWETLLVITFSSWYLPKRVYAHVFKPYFWLPRMVTRNRFEPKTLSAMPRPLSHVSVWTHPSALERAWYELSSIPLEIPVEIFCTKVMFLSNFSLHFFEIDASTKLDFLMQSILLWGWGIKQSQISTCSFFIWVSLGLEFPLWHSVYVLQTADSAGALICSPSFYESFNFCDHTNRAAWLGTVQSCMHIL